jgi:hypothetical protein
MNSIVRNTLAFVVGAVLTMVVNGTIVVAMSKLVPPPPGVDLSNVESVRANIDKFEMKHFAGPFLAHAIGSLVGGLTASLLAASRRFELAMGIGALHLAGGIAAAAMIRGPAWFVALDLAGAYLPMAWIGYKIAETARPSPAATVPATA